MASPLLTVEELAAELQVPVGTVRRWRRYGTGPVGTRVGKHVRYRRADIERWLDANRDQPRVAS
jgi:excisionase family DNA binding protein